MKIANKRKVAILGDNTTLWAGIACFLGLGGFLVWSLTAKLAEGVTTAGQIVVEDNRKIIQHLEGGIVRIVHVREGSLVKKGDLLIELDQLASLAQRDEIAKELAVQQASIQRLQALIGEIPAPDFTLLAETPITDDVRNEIVNQQQSLFENQKTSLATELSVLRARRTTLKSREQNLTSQINAVSRSLSIAQNDLARRKRYLKQKWETIDRVQSVEREVASLEAELSRLEATQNEANVSAKEIDQEIRSAKASAMTSASGELLEARQGVLRAQERLGTSQDILSRKEIYAPRAGKVLNLTFTTIGGVVSPGEPIMEIVPNTSKMVAQVQLKPTDRDAVQIGQTVKAQLSAYKQWLSPRMDGIVESISADLKINKETGLGYYEARIVLDSETLKSNVNVQVIPGMPIQAFIDSGQRRTFADMIIEPIAATIERGTKIN